MIPTSLRLLPCLLIVPLLALPAPLLAQDDELVVVGQSELAAYWRADERSAQSVQLREGPLRYGCMAMPFIIETDGRISPGTRPLLARMGQSADATDAAIDGLYALMMGSLPEFESTWNRTPSAPIYSARSMVVGDARLRAKLGDERWAQLYERLRRMCRIDDLAGWLARYPDQTVVRPLPSEPEAVLAEADPGPPR